MRHPWQGKPKCGYKKKGRLPCGNPAGLGTEHLGEGLCKYHTPATLQGAGVQTEVTTLDVVDDMLPPIKQRRQWRYQLQNETRLAQIMRDMGAELVVERDEQGALTNVDFSFELLAARAMLVNFIERHSSLEDALIVWAKAYEEGDTGLQPPKILDIDSAHKIITAIAKLADTMQKLDAAVPRDQFITTVAEMGEVVNDLVIDENVKHQIQTRWMQICAKHVIL